MKLILSTHVSMSTCCYKENGYYGLRQKKKRYKKITQHCNLIRHILARVRYLFVAYRNVVSFFFLFFFFACYSWGKVFKPRRFLFTIRPPGTSYYYLQFKTITWGIQQQFRAKSDTNLLFHLFVSLYISFSPTLSFLVPSSYENYNRHIVHYFILFYHKWRTVFFFFRSFRYYTFDSQIEEIRVTMEKNFFLIFYH